MRDYNKKPYNEIKENNIIRRSFSNDINEKSLTWHRDKKDRVIIVLENNDWMIQFDNEIPKKFNVNEELFIPKETFHRVIKGTGDLKLEIIETEFEPNDYAIVEVIEEGNKKKKKTKKDACYYKVKSRYDVWPSAYACVPENTSKALTRDGWKHVDELNIGDEIMTYNIENDELEFKPILNLHRYKDVKTNVVRSGNNGFIFEATDNHKWVVKLPEIKGKRLQKYNRINDKSLIETSDLLANKNNKHLVVSAQYNGGENVKLDKIFKYGTNWVKYILDISKEQRQAWLFSAIVYDGNQQKVERLTENTNNLKELDWLYTSPYGKQSFGFKQKDIEHRDAFLLSAFLNSGLVTWKKAKNKDIYSCHYTSNKPLKNTSNFKLVKENISDVWCPETENGTWVMMQETEGRGIITITGNSGALVKCRKVGAANWGNKSNESMYDSSNTVIEKIKSYRIPFKEFNQKMKTDWIPMWKEEYENDLTIINEMVARHLLYKIADDLVGGVEEINFKNESKKPTNHFQMEMYLGEIILFTGPFIYVDDKHKVIAKRTKIEVLNSDYDEIAVLKENYSDEKHTKELIDMAHKAITRIKGKDYAPDVHEIKVWINDYLKKTDGVDELKKSNLINETIEPVDITEDANAVNEVSDFMHYMVKYSYHNKRIVMSHEDKIIYKPKPIDKQKVGPKPRGFWYGFGSSWLDWVRSEMPDWETNYVHLVKVNDSRILKISTFDELSAFTEEFGVESEDASYMRTPYINWPEVAKLYSGIEINPYIIQGRRKFDWYYPWDVASGCVWGEDSIVSIELLDEVEIEREYDEASKLEEQTDFSKEKEQGLNLLKEITADDAYNKFYNNLFNKNDTKLDREIYNKIIQLDPTFNKEKDKLGIYTKWLFRKDNVELLKKTKEEDLYKLNDDLVFFNTAKNKNLLPVDKKDINKFNINTLLDFAFSFKQNDVELMSKTDKEKEIKKDIKKYDLPNWTIIVPKTEEASCYYGKGTKWCTAATGYDNRFNQYYREGDLYILINKQDPSEKYQFHFEEAQFMDVLDRPIDLGDFFNENDDVYNFFTKIIGDDLEYQICLSSLSKGNTDGFENFYTKEFSDEQKRKLLSAAFDNDENSDSYYTVSTALNYIDYPEKKNDFKSDFIYGIENSLKNRYDDGNYDAIMFINELGGFTDENIDDIVSAVGLKDIDVITKMFEIAEHFNGFKTLAAYLKDEDININFDLVNTLENLKSKFKYDEYRKTYESKLMSITILGYNLENGQVKVTMTPKDDNGKLIKYKAETGNLYYKNIVKYLTMPRLFTEGKKTDFSKEKEEGLHGWFARQGGKGKSKGWVDCNTCKKDPETGRKKCKSCGRKEGESRAKYPACRPTPSACGTRGKGKKWGKKTKTENMENVKQKLDEMISNHSKESNNYMFWQNLKTMYHAVSEMKEMDFDSVDSMLSDGHGWALDHIATSKDDVEEVYHFLKNKVNGGMIDKYHIQKKLNEAFMDDDEDDEDKEQKPTKTKKTSKHHNDEKPLNIRRENKPFLPIIEK